MTGWVTGDHVHVGFTLGGMSNRRLLFRDATYAVFALIAFLGAAELGVSDVILGVILDPVIDVLSSVTDGLESAHAAVTRFVESLDS